MEEFKKRIDLHIEHVKKVGLHCATEETTKQALILPLLDILGFSLMIQLGYKQNMLQTFRE